MPHKGSIWASLYARVTHLIASVVNPSDVVPEILKGLAKSIFLDWVKALLEKWDHLIARKVRDSLLQ